MASPPAYSTGSSDEGNDKLAPAGSLPAASSQPQPSAVAATSESTKDVTAQEMLATDGTGVDKALVDRVHTHGTDDLYPDGDREKVAFTEEELTIDEAQKKRILRKVDWALVP